MLDWIKEGRRGPWSIEHFTISKNEAAIYAIGCYGSYSIPPSSGKYTRLYHEKRGVIMSDTRQELFDLWTFKRMLQDTPGLVVHINGLGLGIFAKEALDRNFKVEVLEIDPDVIELVGSQLLALFPDTLTIIQGDALTWRPPKGKRYGVVWHDIWDEITTDNWKEYNLLMRRWGHWALVQGAWARDILLSHLREDRKWGYI